MPSYRDHIMMHSDDDEDGDSFVEVLDDFSDDDDDDDDSHDYDDRFEDLDDVIEFVDEMVSKGNVDIDDALDFYDVPELPDTAPSEEKLLFTSAAQGDVGQVRSSVGELGAPVNARDARLATPLCFAAAHNHASTVAALLELGADPLAATQQRATPLSLAAARGHTDVVKLLLPKCGAAANARGIFHAMCVAAYKGHEAVVDVFVAAGWIEPAEATEGDPDTPLLRACKSGHLAIVRTLLKHGADVERAARGETPLHVASDNNHPEIVDALLQHGALVNQRAVVPPDNGSIQFARVRGGSALIRAAYGGHAKVVELLIQAGADPSIADDDGDTPLIAAVAKKHNSREDTQTIVEALLTAGADVDQVGYHNNTPILVAASSGLDNVVAVLLERFNARLDIVNDHGETVLAAAIERCTPATVQLVLARKPAVDQALENRDTALHKAVEKNSAQIVRWLLDAGANINAQNDAGDTPLMLACQLDLSGSSQAVIECLVEAGADLDITNRHGETAVVCGRLGSSASGMCTLLRAGAKVDWESEVGGEVFERICRKVPAEAADVIKARLQGMRIQTVLALLQRALVSSLPDIVPLLVDRGRSMAGDDGSNLLMLAAKMDDPTTLKHLLECGFDLEARNTAGETAMESVTRDGFFGSFCALVGAGAKLCDGVNARLMLAAMQQRWADVEATLRAQNKAAEGSLPDGGAQDLKETLKRRLPGGDDAAAPSGVTPKRSRLSLDLRGEARGRGHDAAGAEASTSAAVAATPAAPSRVAASATPMVGATPGQPDGEMGGSLAWLADLCEMDPIELMAPSRSVAGRILQLVRKRLSFGERLDMFRARMEEMEDYDDEESLEGSMNSAYDDDVLHVHVARGSVLYDAYKTLKRLSAYQLRLPLSVTFEGEDSHDEGGPSREFYTELAKELTKPDLALFKEVPEGSGAFQPNPDAHVQQDAADVPSLFRFIGCMVGKAISASHVFNMKFTHSFLKQMLGGKLTLDDLESVDPLYYKGLTDVLSKSVEESGLQGETFTTEENFFGENRVIELKPGGADIEVKDENKMEYITLLAQHRMTTSIKPYIEEFCKGVWNIVPAEMLQAFSPTELGEVISGFPEIDVNEMQECAVYEGFDASSQVIRWFWQIVREMSHEEVARLLQFITGSPKVPATGFAGFEPPICIKRGSDDRLPSAHTCIHQLVLSDYKTRQALAAHLQEILKHSTGFGFA